MKNFAQYAIAGLVVVLVVAAAVSYAVKAEQRSAVWFAAGLGYVIQLAAYGVLLRFRDDPQFFLLGWAVGIGLRFLTIGIVAFVVSRTKVLPLDVTLLSLVGFVVLLLFMEPLFLRRGPATK